MDSLKHQEGYLKHSFKAWFEGDHGGKYSRVIVESDSGVRVDLIYDYPDRDHPMLDIILECMRMHHVMWDCQINWVPRNYNQSADGM